MKVGENSVLVVRAAYIISSDRASLFTNILYRDVAANSVIKICLS